MGVVLDTGVFDRFLERTDHLEAERARPEQALYQLVVGQSSRVLIEVLAVQRVPMLGEAEDANELGELTVLGKVSDPDDLQGNFLWWVALLASWGRATGAVAAGTVNLDHGDGVVTSPSDPASGDATRSGDHSDTG